MSGQLRLFTPRDSDGVVRYLDGQPDRDLYLRSLVWRLGVHLPESAGELLGWIVDDEVRGVFLHSRVLVLACDDPEGVEAFADRVAAAVGDVPPLQIVSPAQMTRRLLSGLERRGVLPPVRLHRPSMPTLRVDRDTLLPRGQLRSGPGRLVPAPVRNAGESELALVRFACRAVTIEELGVDPEELDPGGFELALARRLRAGREYLWLQDGELLFRAALSAVTPDAALVEGVWTSPDHRGQGIGTLGMHALCERLLQWHSRVVLFVGADNQPARRLYDRLGFVQFGDYVAAWFDDPDAAG